MAGRHVEAEQMRGSWLSWLALSFLGVIAPIFMIVSTRSLATTVGIGSVVAGAAWIERERGWPRLALLPRMILIALFVALLWATIAILWTPDPADTVKAILPLWGSVVTGVVGIYCAPKILPPSAFRFLAIGVVVAAILLIVEFSLGSPIRVLLNFGIHHKTSPPAQINRMDVVVAVLVWPLLWALAARGARVLALAVFGLVAVACTLSESQSSELGLLAGLVVLAAAMAAPRLTGWVVAGGAVAVMITTPWLMYHLQDVIPKRELDLRLLKNASGAIRLQIWREFAGVFFMHPWLGFGFNASTPVIAHVPETAGLSASARAYLAYGHPHDALLQAWVELGAVGGVLFTLLLGLGAFGVARLEGLRGRFALAAFASAFAIACVSHGAWQAWWTALLGLVVMWFRVPQPSPEGAASLASSETRLPP